MSVNRALRRVVRGQFDTSDLPNAAFTRPQAEQFWSRAQEKASPFFRQVPVTQVSDPSDALPRVGFSTRQLRAATEGVDSGITTEPTTDSVNYTVVDMALVQDMTRKSIRRASDPDFFEKLMAGFEAQFGADLEDLAWNGDTTTLPGAPDADFLGINDGWIRLITVGGHVTVGSGINGGDLCEEHLAAMLADVPDRYFQLADGDVQGGIVASNYRWVMSKTQWLNWQKYLAARTGVAGDQALGGVLGRNPVTAPFGIPIAVVRSLTSSVALLTSWDYLRVVTTMAEQNMMDLVVTSEGRELAVRGATTAVIHTDADFVLMENEAHAITTTLNT